MPTASLEPIEIDHARVRCVGGVPKVLGATVIRALHVERLDRGPGVSGCDVGSRDCGQLVAEARSGEV